MTGGMETALMLWETCCIPSLMHGAGTWVEMTSETVKRLNKIQNYFVRLVLWIGQGSPLAGILWDTSLLDMKFRVYIEKLMIIMHLRSLDKDTLANQFYEEQKIISGLDFMRRQDPYVRSCKYKTATLLD